MEILLLCLILLISLAIGFKILKFLISRDIKIEDESFIIFSMGIGLGVISLGTLFIGLLGLLYAYIFYIIVAILFVISIKEIKEIFLFIFSIISNLRIKVIILLMPLISTALVNFIGALAPPVFFDDLSAHLALPKLYIINNRIFFYQYNVYGSYPINIEMLYLFGMLLIKSDVLPKLIHWSLGVLSAIAVYSLSKRHFGKMTAYISTLAYYTIPSVSICSTLAMHENGVVFFQLLSVYALLNFVNSPESQVSSIKYQTSSIKYQSYWLVLSGIMCGLAVGSKYTAIYFSVSLFIVFIIYSLFLKIKLSRIIKNAVIWSIIVLIVSSPWFIKNIIYTRNPVYPALSNIFGLSEFQKEGTGEFHNRGYNNFWEFLMLPINVVIHSERFGSASNIGYWLLITIPIAIISFIFLKKEEKSKVLFLFGISFLYSIFWAITIANTRYYLTGIALLTIVGTHGTNSFLSLCKSFITHHLSPITYHLLLITYYLTIAIVLLFNWYNYIKVEIMIFNPYPVVFGIEDREEYIKSRVPYYQTIKYANENLPKDSKILFIGETRGYYCERNFIANSAYDRTVIVELIKKSNDINDLLKELKSLGITHILYNAVEGGRLGREYSYFNWSSKRDEELFFELKNYLKTLYYDDSKKVYLFEILY